MTQHKRITIKDIAAELGLDYSSVGYALRDKGTLSEETRLRIKAMAEEMGYVRNHAASQMREQRSYSIGLIVPNLLLGYNEFSQHLLTLARERGYRLNIAVSEFDPALEEDGVRTMLAAGVDGLILRSMHHAWSRVPAGAMLRTFRKLNIPVVSHGETLRGSGFSAVIPEPDSGIVPLAAHLFEQGFKSPVFLLPCMPSQLSYSSADIERLRQALRSAGVADELPIVMLDEEDTSDPNNVAYKRHLEKMLAHAGVEIGRELLHRALAAGSTPDILICQNEMTAIGVIMEAQRLGISIPGQFGVCATTRNMLVALSPITLTHVDVYNADLAAVALDLLLAEIENRTPAGQVRRVPRCLTLGNSTKRR